MHTRLIDKDNNEVVATKFGQLIVADRTDDILVRFEYNNSSYDVEVTASGSATITNANSMAVVTSGQDVSRGILTSKHHLVYHPGHEAQAHFTALFTNDVDSASYLRAGLYDDSDGFYLGYESDTFGVTLLSGGTATFVAITDFNKDRVDGSCSTYNKSHLRLDPSKLNIYRISYGWLGAAPVSFAVYGGQDKGWVTLHVLDIPNTQTVPTTNSPSNHIRFEAGRSASSGNAVIVKTASWQAGSTGHKNGTGLRGFSQVFELTASANVTSYMGTIRNNATHLTKENKVKTRLSYFGAATDGTKTVNFKLIKNASLTGANYTDIDSDNSVTSYDISATLSGGTTEMTFPMQKIDTLGVNVVGQEIFLLPSETLSVVARGSANSTVAISLRWQEEFA